MIDSGVWRKCGVEDPKMDDRYWCKTMVGSFDPEPLTKKCIFRVGTGWRTGDWVVPLEWLDES